MVRRHRGEPAVIQFVSAAKSVVAYMTDIFISSTQ